MIGNSENLGNSDSDKAIAEEAAVEKKQQENSAPTPIQQAEQIPAEEKQQENLAPAPIPQVEEAPAEKKQQENSENGLFQEKSLKLIIMSICEFILMEMFKCLLLSLFSPMIVIAMMIGVMILTVLIGKLVEKFQEKSLFCFGKSNVKNVAISEKSSIQAISVEQNLNSNSSNVIENVSISEISSSAQLVCNQSKEISSQAL